MAASNLEPAPSPGSELRAHRIAGHRGRSEHVAWSRWMEAAAALADRWWVEFEDDPFMLNETASVSHLCSAAAAAGMLGLAEYSVTKKYRFDRRWSARGRVDLFVSDHRRSWAFEFKQLNLEWYDDAMLGAAMAAAVDCAVCVRQSEADLRVAAVVASMSCHMPDDMPEARDVMLSFGLTCDYAWRIGASGNLAPETYLYFTIV